MRTLLETLQQRLGCLYLSDLHTDNFRLQALQEALSIRRRTIPRSSGRRRPVTCWAGRRPWPRRRSCGRCWRSALPAFEHA